MKEYEDQLSQLKKENFNLKLRIYFLEERMGHMSSADDKDDPVKKNIELKVEAETLRKDVCDKQELLCQAARALDLMEEQHREELKKIQEERDLEKGMLESRIHELEAELKDPKFLQLDSTALIKEAFGLCATSACVEQHTHDEVEKLQKHIETLEAQIQQLECTLQEETVNSKQLDADLQEAQQENERVRVRCQGLELEMKQRDSRLEDLVQELEQKGQDLAGCNLRIRTLEEALSAKEPEIQIKVQELCERDRIIEEKQTQIDQQNKVLVEIQITLDEKQRQIEALRSSLADRDASIAGLEGRLAKSKANTRNLEAKLDAAIHEGNRLREELATVKVQHKRMSNQSREHLQQELDLLSPLRRKSRNLSSRSDEMASSSRHSRQSFEDSGTVRKQLLGLKQKETPKIAEDCHKQEIKAQLEGAQQEVKALEAKVKQLETELQDAECKMQETEKKLKEKEDKLKKLEEESLKHYHAVKCFMQRTKKMGREIDQLKSEAKKKDRCICDLKSELNELKDAYNKAIWEARQLQAQAQVQGGGGLPGAFEDVRDMTEEENERLWAEVEDKNKKLAQLTKERDSLSNEMEKQVQALFTSLKEKEIHLEEFEKKTATSANELEARDNRIKELEEDLSHLRKELHTLQVVRYEMEGKHGAVEISKDVSDVKENKNGSMPDELVTQLEDKNREIERLNGELRKRTNNLQELVNKELWDKNREIEKLQDRLKSACEKKELEIMSLQQQVCARDFQLKMLQEKVAELGTHANILPTSLMVKEFQQLPVTFNQHVHFQHTSLSSGETLKNETGDVSRAEFGTASVLSGTCAANDEVTCLRDQLQASVEEKKYLCSKVEELREKLRNTPERDNDSRALRSECARLRDELDRANVWRKEAGEACALLTKRLEELARFLSSLLKHPERLGSLRAKHRQLLEQAVERSMELSRSLSVSLCTNKHDLTNGSLPPLMDSFSSLLMCTSDINLSIIDLLGEDESEISGYDPVQQENLKSGTSVFETTLTPNNQCCRSSGGNSEIAQMQRMKGSTTAEVNCVSRDKIVAEQAQVIVQLRSQVETLTHEIKQRDIEFVRLQKDELNMCTRADAAMGLSGPRTGTSSPSKLSNASSGSVWKSRNETERLVDIEETKSLSSMTFYNSRHLSNNIGEQWSNESQTVLPTVGKNLVPDETRALLEAVSSCHQEKCIQLSRSVRSPVKSTNAISEGVAMDAGRSVLKKQDHLNGTKSPIRYRMCRSASASAVALSQLQQPVYHQDVATGSLSESEAWSEPDRNVSLARIGLKEESSKVVLSPGTGISGSGCTAVGSIRSRNGRIIQEEADTSESSEETAHETSRIQVKRGRTDAGEVRRLQNRLRALEQVNEALRAEVTILHQLAPPPPAVTNNTQSAHDTNIGTSITSEEKLDKSTSVEQFECKASSNVSSVTIPIQLLDQIRFQREKLESSLYHNDLIRHQLEGLMSSLSSQGDDNMMSLWQKMKDMAEQLEEARHQSQELETQLQEMREQLEDSKEKTRLASAAFEQLEVTRQTVSILQEQMSSLESRLQEKDNEILERKCLMLELENQTKQQSIEAEKMVQEAMTLKEEAERQLQTGERMKLEGDSKLQEARKLFAEAEKTKLEVEGQMIEMKKKSEDAKLWIKDAEIQTSMLQIEKESLLREKEAIQKYKEITQIEKDEIKKVKETIQREKEIIEHEKKSLVNMQKEMKERMIKFESLVHDAKKQKEEAEMQIMAAKKKLQEAEILKEDAEKKLKVAEEMDMRTKEMEVQLTQQLCEAKKKLQESECVSNAEMEKKVREAERLSRECKAELRRQIEEAQKREGEIRAEADTKIKDIAEQSKEREIELKKHLQESERHFREKECKLMRKLDEVTLTVSQAALDRTRLANEKLRLEQEVRRHEAREAELVHEKKNTENCLLVAKEQLEKQMALLQQQKNGLEKRVKELEAANLELMVQLDKVHIKEQSLSTSGGPDSSCLTHMKIGRTSPGSYSSGLDLMTGDGGSLSGSPWGTTATVSLEYSGSQNEDKGGSRRGSDGGHSVGLTAVSSMVLQHGFGRQRSELSDYVSEDQALEEYGAIFTQTRNSSYWVTALTEQHSTPSNSVPGDPSLMRNINSSPDLGIESDQGRFSSLEATSSGVQIDTPKAVSTVERHGSGLDPDLSAVVINSGCDTALRTYKELEQENTVLKRRLARTHHALEETLAQLTAANQRKKQVERAICNQLHKTHHILKRVRVNLDTETVDGVSPSAKEME